MKSSTGMTVGRKLTLSFGALLGLLGVVVIASIYEIRVINANVAEIVDDRVVKVAMVTDIDQNLNLQARTLRNAILAGKTRPDEAKSSLERLQKSADETAALVDKLKARMNTPAGQAALDELTKARGAYGAVREKTVEKVRAGDYDAATALVFGDLRTAQGAYLKEIEDMLKLLSDQMAAAGDEAKASGQQAITIMLVVAALSTAVAIGLGVTITRGLTGQLGGEPDDVRRIAAAVAEGDLAVSVSVRPGDDGSVMAAMRAMRDRLATVVSQVRQSSDSIATGSAQIATGNADLSQRTEEQASNLQQTAASMEELTSSVKSNADTTTQASRLASSASDAAARGGEVVGEVVSTMQAIADSSKKISDIIGVIDGIAFQTNILALNAAVEAARAGEQGRGFAVVASEVRTLAQRSASAAKEIKSLISDSVEKVETGTRQVDAAGTSMQEIVRQVQSVNQLISEVNAATAEQTSGIGQVGDAVTQLDQVTQQNAALVEESAAAAESLRLQAARLAEVVSVFRLDAGQAAVQRTVAPASPAVQAKAVVQAARSSAKAPPAAKPAAPPTPAPKLAAKAPAAPVRDTVVASAAPGAAKAEGDWETF